MDGQLVLRLVDLLSLPADFAIHQELTVRVLSNIWLHSVDEDAASDFSRASNCSNRKVHHYSLKPAKIVSEDVTLASSGCVVVDDNIGLGRDGHFCSDAANRVHKEYFGDLISTADVSKR